MKKNLINFPIHVVILKKNINLLKKSIKKEWIRIFIKWHV